MFAKLPGIPNLRPMFNLGCVFDIPTGTYYQSAKGNYVLNSGLSYIVSVIGPPNSFKSAILDYFHMIVADRFTCYKYSKYDTESSASYARINGLAARFPNLCKIDHGNDLLAEEDIKIKITSSVDILGDVYFEAMKEVGEANLKAKKYITTPFLHGDGRPIKILQPVGFFIDSLSEFKVTATADNLEKNNIGDSGNNMYHMKQGSAKQQFSTQLPNLCPPHGMYVTCTAHVGDEKIMDPNAPKKHKLAYSKKGCVVKGVGSDFNYLNNLLFEIYDSAPLNNKDYNTGVLYPALESDRDKSCVDLMRIPLVLTRNKSGQSGYKYTVIVSQREGVLPHLTQFHEIKESDRYGLVGNNTTYSLILLPNVKVSRTTVRNIIDTNEDFRRALEFTCEMCQIKYTWATLSDNLLCTPEELYEDITKLGYDWNILFKTRGWWCPVEQEETELPQLSTMDLLQMRKGNYHPYFLEADKVTYSKKYKHLLNT